jgi:acid-sensing ion channel, other
MVIFAVSIYFCLSNVLEINEHRKNRPVMLSFSKTKLQNFDTPFPSVTICLEEKIKKSEIDLSEARRNSIFQNISQVKMQALAQICHFDNDQHFMEILNISHPITKNLTKVIEEISLSDYEIFSKCHLGTEKNVDCRKIFQKTITDEGICYSFNMLDHKDLLTDKIDDSLRYPIVDKKSSWFLSKDYEKGDIDAYPRRAIGYGIKDGIYVRLRMNISDFNPGCKRSTRGFRVKIHLPVDYPTISRSYYSIPFNKQTMLMLTPNMVYSSKDIKVYEPQARKCYFPGERKLDFFKIYTKLSCDSECLAKKVIEACGCVEFSMPRDNSTEICDTTKIPCVHKAKKNYQMLSLNKKLLSKQLKRQLANGEIKDDDKKFKELKKMKTCDCLPACVSIDYSAEIQEIDILQDNMKHSE